MLTHLSDRLRGLLSALTRIAAALAAIALAGLAASPFAYATEIAGPTMFYFTGQCTDCTGTATAMLVLDDYDPANPSSATFVNFEYSSNLTQFTIDDTSTAPLISMTGSLPFSSTPAFTTFQIVGGNPPAAPPGQLQPNAYGFSTDGTTGDWQVVTGIFSPSQTLPAGNQLGVNKDSGTDGVWSTSPLGATPVPEPGTLSLMLLGAIGILAARRRCGAARTA